jgi:hypothetical protein
MQQAATYNSANQCSNCALLLVLQTQSDDVHVTGGHLQQFQRI